MKWLVLLAACAAAPPERLVQPKRLPRPPASTDVAPWHGEVPSEDALLDDVRWLADPARHGRGSGTADEAASAKWIAARLAELNLRPTIDAHHNVIAWLPGFKADAPWVLVGAHHDHLGVGYPGADDNASGVAAMLGIADALARSDFRRGGVLFVAFGEEEIGLRGSQAFVAQPPMPLAGCAAMINLDMVGRSPFLGAKEYAAKQYMGIPDGPAVGVLDDASGSPLLATARTATAAAGIKMYAAEDFALVEGMVRAQAAGRSDDASFAAAGVKTLFFSTSLQDDYHQPTDTVDKIDKSVLRKVAVAVRLVVDELRR